MRLSSLGCERWRKRMYPGCTSWCPPTSRCLPWRTQWQVQLIQVLIESEAVTRTSLTTAVTAFLLDSEVPKPRESVYWQTRLSNPLSTSCGFWANKAKEVPAASRTLSRWGKMEIRLGVNVKSLAKNARAEIIKPSWGHHEFQIPNSEVFFGRNILFWLLVPVEEFWISRLFFG